MTREKEPVEEDFQCGGRLHDATILSVILGAYLLVAFGSFMQPGLAWDEGLYIPYAEGYLSWFAQLPGSLNWNDFNSTLGHISSHPPLAKYVMAAAIWLLGGSIGPLYAARVAGVGTTAALLAAVYLFTLRTRGRFEAVLAALFLVLMPRFFANGVLAVLDMPAALWWFAAAALFYAAMEKRKLAWLAGLAAALAFCVKINALMLPLVLWPWGLYFHRRKAMPAIIWSLALTPVVFFALWPFLWGDPLISVGKYFGEKFGFVVSIYRWFGVDLLTHGDPFHRMLQRTAVPVLYFGRVHAGGVPWHYPIVITAITTPPGILAAALAGAARWARERESARLFSFLILNIVFWPFVFALHIGQAYDGVRLFLSIFPFVAVLAAIGVRWGYDVLRRFGAPRHLGWVLVVLLVAGQAPGLYNFRAFGLSYYNGLVGGLDGAADKGFDVTFWGETVDDRPIGFVNGAAPEGARIAAFPMGWFYVSGMLRFGLLRGDLVPVEHWQDWDYLFIANRGAYLADREDMRALARKAVVTGKVRGVPAAWLVEKSR